MGIPWKALYLGFTYVIDLADLINPLLLFEVATFDGNKNGDALNTCWTFYMNHII